jgi:Ca-activated chloride channel family protein
MSLTWPLALLSIFVVPLVLSVYLWKLRRRRKHAVRYSSVALLRSVLPKGSRLRRHLPVALLLTSLALLGFASSRPQITRQVPRGRTSIILALDVSRSMCSTDVAPNRLTVAQAAARTFVQDQPAGTRIGIVVFSGFAQLAVPPTTDRKELLGAIDGLTTAVGTAIGSAILKGLDAIAEVNPNVAPVGDAPPTSVGPPGANGVVPAIVVLLTVGANTRGIKPLEAVPYAVERGVRVYTIGFGTTQPAAMVCSRTQLGGAALGADGGARGLGGGGFRGGGAQGGGSPLVADEATLQAVADQTGGQHYTAQDTGQLKKVFADLPKDVVLQKEHVEISSVFAAIGALLAAAAVAASLRWSPYP